MDGITLTRELQEILDETSGSSYLDSKSTYDYLYEAAIQTVARTDALTTTQTITTVASQTDYYLNADFIKLYLMDDQNKHFIKYYDTSNYYFVYPNSYDSIVLGNNTTSQSIPNAFCIRPGAAIAQKTGTATASGAATNGLCTLTDSAANFTTANINAGDFISNITDGSHGVVVSVTSANALVCALFGGTDNDWTTTIDSYSITPQARFYLTLDPPSLTSSHTITVYYVPKPAPVYSPYHGYKIPLSFKGALVKYAAWLYKYRDREPSYGDAWFKYWDATVRELGRNLKSGMDKGGFGVNLKVRASRGGSYR